jgi:hypothetical protein
MPSNYVPSLVNVVKDCTLKTPGAMIRSSLEKVTNADENMNEMVGALSNGVDAVLGALLNKVLDVAKSSLANGLFDSKTQAARAAYASEVTDGSYVTALDELSTNADAGTIAVPCLDPSDTVNYGTMNACAPLVAAGTVTTGIPSSGGFGLSQYSGVNQVKNNALTLINSLIKAENDYQNNYLIALNVLTQGQVVFATSSACNMSFGSSESALRALLIRANVVTNINGTSNSDRTIASIPWNIIAIKSALASSTAKLAILQKAGTEVQNASGVVAITDAMIPVNSTTFDSDPQKNMVPNIRTWFGGVKSPSGTWTGGVQGMYTSIICPIDITDVLKINSPATTGF